jgi:O-antigen ligase
VAFRLLLLFLVVLFANLPFLVPRVEAVAPAQTLAIAALLVLFLERAVRRQPFRLAWPESHFLLAFLGVAALSTATALWPRYALENTLTLAKFLAVYLLISDTVTSWKRQRQVVWALAIAGLFPALGALDHMRRGILVDGERANWLGIFGNPNDLAFALVLLVAPVVAGALAERGWRRLLLGGTVASFVVAIFLTYSRGGLAALALVGLLCLIGWGGRWMALPAVLLVAAVLLAGYPFGWARAEGYTGLEGDRSVRQRIGAVRAGLAMFGDYPVLGVGPGCSLLGWPHYAPAELADEGWLHSHNTVVQALSETGLAGTLLFGGALAAAFVKARRAARRWRRAGRRDLARRASALEISLWAFLACGVGGGYLLTWFPYLLLGLVSAVAAIPVPATAPSPGAAGRPLPERLPCAASPAS